MKRVLVLLGICLFHGLVPTFAYSDTGFRQIHLSGDFKKLKSEISRKTLQRSLSKNYRLTYEIPAIKFKGSIPGLGRTEIILNKRRVVSSRFSAFSSESGVKEDVSDIILFKGRIKTKDSQGAAAASVFPNKKGELELNIHLSGKRGFRTRLNAYLLSLPADSKHSSKATFVKTPNLKDFACNSLNTENQAEIETTSDVPSLAHAKDATQAADTQKILELSIFADAEWYAAFGSESNSRMLSVINASETIYESQIGVIFDVVSSVTFTSNPDFLTSTTANVLLSSFGNYMRTSGLNPTADIHHLFSGKVLNDNIGGIAYYNAVCAHETLSRKVGISRNLGGLTYLVLAHELGHNFSAGHDIVTTPLTLMHTHLGESQTYFSATSISQIQNYITNSGSCLTTNSQLPPENTATPVFTPTTAVMTPKPPIEPSPTATSTFTKTFAPTFTATSTRTNTPTVVQTQSSAATAAPTAFFTPVIRFTSTPTPIIKIITSPIPTTRPQVSVTQTPTSPPKGTLNPNQTFKVKGQVDFGKMISAYVKHKTFITFKNNKDKSVTSKKLNNSIGFATELKAGKYTVSLGIKSGNILKIIPLGKLRISGPVENLVLTVSKVSNRR